jgi:hypothetical protein
VVLAQGSGAASEAEEEAEETVPAEDGSVLV